MSDKPTGRARKSTSSSNKDSGGNASSNNSSSSKSTGQNASRVTPIRASTGAAQESPARQIYETGKPKGSGQPDQKITEQIRIRAYQLFEERGRHAGCEQQDWIRAEAEVLAKFHGEKSA